jgi:hypothetical protein
MRAQIWLVLALLVILICGCGAKDPVIGTWADTRTGEDLIEFRADGTVIFDTDIDKMAARMLATHPEWAERLKDQTGPTSLSSMREAKRSQKASWTKSGDIYTVSLETLGRTLAMCYKLDQGVLKDWNNQKSDGTYVLVKK